MDPFPLRSNARHPGGWTLHAIWTNAAQLAGRYARTQLLQMLGARSLLARASPKPTGGKGLNAVWTVQYRRGTRGGMRAGRPIGRARGMNDDGHARRRRGGPAHAHGRGS